MSSSLLRGNAAHFESWASERIARWLLTEYVAEDPGEIQFLPEPSSRAQLASTFDLLTPAGREQFKDGVVRAIAEWRPSPTEPESAVAALIELSYVASDTRSVRALPLLREALRAERIHTRDPDLLAACYRAVIGVIASFAPTDEARETLLFLHYAPTVPSRFSSMTYTGLCRCDPFQFDQHLPRFLQAAQQNVGLFRMDLIASQIVKYVPLPFIASRIGSLVPPDVLGPFVSMLTVGPEAPAKLCRRWKWEWALASRQEPHTFYTITFQSEQSRDVSYGILQDILLTSATEDEISIVRRLGDRVGYVMTVERN